MQSLKKQKSGCIFNDSSIFSILNLCRMLDFLIASLVVNNFRTRMSGKDVHAARMARKRRLLGREENNVRSN